MRATQPIQIVTIGILLLWALGAVLGYLTAAYLPII